MKRIISLSVFLFALVLASCSDSDPVTPNSDNLVFKSGITSTTLTKASATQVTVDRVRILVKNIKVKLNGEERLLKAGPAMFEVTSANPSIAFAQGDVPAGQFDKVSYEIHRFESSVLQQYANDPVFGAFATSDRHTIIVNGKVTDSSGTRAFEYKTDVVGNLNFDFNPAVTVADDKLTTVEFEFLSNLVFHENGVLIDPTDPTKKSHIDNQLKNALKAIVK